MEVKVRFLDNLRLEASFDDFKIITDQPIRYKGDGTAPSPFDYFLASSALCAAYFVKVYCKARGIPTEDIQISQHNIIDPENRYNQTFKLQVELPEGLSERDKAGILRSMDRCTVKKVVQEGPHFDLDVTESLATEAGLVYDAESTETSKTMILGRDTPLEDTISQMTGLLRELGIRVEIASWRNLVPHVWSVHIRDAESPMCFTNGKGASKNAALCSALGEYMERISCNYFYNDYYLGTAKNVAEDFVHYPNEKWFSLNNTQEIPEGILDSYTKEIYNCEGELKGSHLVDMNSGQPERGICAIPFIRQSDRKEVYFPVNLVGNLFVSNGMSAGNSILEARVQCLSEIFERSVKNHIIREELTLPDVPKVVLNRYPQVQAGIAELEAKGYPVYVKDASLGGAYPVMCVTLMNPRNGGVFASFGAHPKFEVALERSLTELLQGRSFEGLNDVLAPTFNSSAVNDDNNIVEHFIDSTGVVSWKFFSSKPDYAFVDWNIDGSTSKENAYLMDILEKLEKEVYIADYVDLGAHACRILVPGYSEIYPIDDLLWDNTNRANDLRKPILHIHSLSVDELDKLLKKLDDLDVDSYTRISELIGIEFDENTAWGQCDIGELKGLIQLATGDLEAAKEQVESFLTFNDNPLKERKSYYQALNIVLDIHLREDLHYADYEDALSKLYGEELISNVKASVTGELKFFGLSKTSMNLEGLDRHQKLIESFEKLRTVRKKFQTYENA